MKTRNKYVILNIIILTLFSNLRAEKFLFVAVNGIPPTNFPGPIEGTFLNLEDAHSYILNNLSSNGNITDDITVYITEGVYEDAGINWSTTSPFHTMKISSYENDKVVYDGLNNDGTLKGRFFGLVNKYEQTNLIIEGLIIQNYLQGIRLGVFEADLQNCVFFSQSGTSHNTIRNNVFLQIGNKHSSGEQASFSALAINTSTYNLVESNIFYKIENDKILINSSGQQYESRPLVHAIYIAHYSKGNTIINNYVGLCSGNPFNLRGGSDDNTFIGNYIEQSGDKAFVYAWHGDDDCPDECCFEPTSHGTYLENNIFTFPHPDSDEITIDTFASKNNATTYINGGNNFVVRTKPICEEIVDMTSGDINGDGIDELFVAFNYSNFTKLARTEPNKSPYLSKVIYKNKYARIGAIEMNDFDGNGVDEIIMGLNDFNDDYNTMIFKGNGFNSAINFGSLYMHAWWNTSEFTSGDYDHDGAIEIITAFNAPNNGGDDVTQIVKGDGNSSITNFGQLYSSSNWITTSMTSGDFDNDDFAEVFVALNSIYDNNSKSTKIVKGDGVTDIDNQGEFYSSDWWITKSISSGDYDGDGSDEIYVAFNDPNNTNSNQTQIRKGDGQTSVTNLGLSYNSDWWESGKLVSGKFSNQNNSDVVSTYEVESQTQLFIGDGDSSISNFGQFYKSYNTQGDDCPENFIITNADEILWNDDSFKVFPNPIDNISEIKIEGASKNVEISIYNSIGQLLYLSIYSAIDSADIKIPQGIYFVLIEDSNNKQMGKLIIK